FKAQQSRFPHAFPLDRQAQDLAGRAQDDQFLGAGHAGVDELLGEQAPAAGGGKNQQYLAVFRSLAFVNGKREAELVSRQRFDRKRKERALAGKDDAQAVPRAPQGQADVAIEQLAAMVVPRDQNRGAREKNTATG